MFNRTTGFILIAALAAGLGLWAAQHWLVPSVPAAPQLQVVRLFDHPRALPPFSLEQSDHTQLVPGELKGHWTVVFLGFTHCLDVCPTTLAQLAQAQKEWARLPDSTRPRVLFVSVDPERDAPDAVGEYAHAFHRDTLAATTTDIPALKAFARSLSMVFMKVSACPGPRKIRLGLGSATMTIPAPPCTPEVAKNYSIDHSAALALLDPQARMAGMIPPPVDPKAIAADLLVLAQGSSQ